MSRRIGDFSTTLREQIIKEHPFCEVCGIFKTAEIHHIIPMCDGGTSDRNNLVALCEFCHKCAPGKEPDGYVEEFEIYKSAGGILWHFFRLGFMAAGYKYSSLNTKQPYKLIKDCNKTRKQCGKLIRGGVHPGDIHIMMG